MSMGAPSCISPLPPFPRPSCISDFLSPSSSGVVNPLAMVGQDALWLDTFVDDFGLNKTDLLRDFFAGPTFQPWHWMGNLNGWGGPIDENFLRQQLELQKKITARMIQFGMRPVLPGFAGHVPAQMQQAFPGAGVTQLNPWHGHFPTGTFFLPPAASPASSALFRRIAQKFMRRQAMALGVEAWSEPHYFLADAYNEMPPLDTDPKVLASVSRGMYESMAVVDSHAVMVTQGWFLRNVPAAPWGEEQARAFLQGPPLGKLLALDLEAIKNPVWKRTRSFYGIPFAFCMLHNFGERPGLFGQLPTIVSATPAALRESAPGTMVGTGMTPEGLGTNPVVYDLFAEMFWRGGDSAPDLDRWVADYWQRRYGRTAGGLGAADANSCDVNAAKAWRLLSASVYSAPVEVAGANASNWKWGDGPHSSDMAARPALGGGRIPDSVALPYYNVSAVEVAWSALLMCSRHTAIQHQLPLGDDVQGYTYDLVATGRQVLSDHFNAVRGAFQQAVGKTPPDAAEAKRIGAGLLDMIDDMDTLLGSHHSFLLGNWLSDAEGWAAQSSTNTYGESLMEDARRVITLWGHPSSRNDTHNSRLSQYSYRLWAGLVRGFYRPRWETFIAAVVRTISAGNAFDAAAQTRVDQEITWWEEQWVGNASNTAAKFGTTARGSPTAIAQSLCAKYHIAGCTTPLKTEDKDDHAAAWAPVQVTVNPSAVQPGPPVSPVFVGLSTETYEAVKLYGTGTPRAALAQALLNFKALTPDTKEGPVMRVGGVSADSSCWKTVADNNLSCQHCPGQKDCQSVRCCQHNITETDLDAYASFAGIGAELSTVFSRLNASFVLTTNLGYGPDPARAAAEVAAILKHRVLSAVSSLEIGNEVASYHDGHRSRLYSFADYSRELTEYVAAFRALQQAGQRLPAQFLQAAVFAHPYDWSEDPSLTMPVFLQQHASATISLCMHSYALTGVERKSGNLSAETLLAPYCSKYHASTYARLAADARAAGVEFVIGEGNSVSGGGQANISDVYISALWALDFLPEISQVGAARFNFHGGIDNRSRYAAIVLDNPDDAHSRILVRPLFYGLFAFSEFVANHSSWVRSSSSCSSTHRLLCSNTAVHANVDEYDSLKVLVISKELRSCPGCAVRFLVRLTGAAVTHGEALSGTIAFMHPGHGGSLSKAGITWAGLSFDGTVDGKPRKLLSSSREVVRGTLDGNDLLFKLDVPQLSAAVLTVRRKTDDVPVKPLKMKPLGAYCGAHNGAHNHTNASGCLETTPIMWHGELLMVEHHQHFRVRRQAYPPLDMMSNDALITGVPGSEEVA